MSASEDYLPWDVLKENRSALLVAISYDAITEAVNCAAKRSSAMLSEGDVVDWTLQETLP